MSHEGKITAVDMQKIELEFRQLRKELPTISDEEVHRHLMKKLPSHMVNWIADEEVRLKSEHPRVIWTLPAERSIEEVALSVRALIGEIPERILKLQPRIFVLTFREQATANKMLELNGSPITETGTQFHIRPASHYMTLDRVFSFMEHRLEGREKADSYLRTSAPPQNNRWRSPNRDPRYVRVTDIDDDEESEQSEAKEEQRTPRSRGRSRSRDRRRSRERSTARSVSPVVTEIKDKGKTEPPKTQLRPPSPPMQRSEEPREMSNPPDNRGRTTWPNANQSWSPFCQRCKRHGHYASNCATDMSQPHNREWAGWTSATTPLLKGLVRAKARGRVKARGKAKANKMHSIGDQILVGGVCLTPTTAKPRQGWCCTPYFCVGEPRPWGPGGYIALDCSKTPPGRQLGDGL